MAFRANHMTTSEGSGVCSESLFRLLIFLLGYYIHAGPPTLVLASLSNDLHFLTFVKQIIPQKHGSGSRYGKFNGFTTEGEARTRTFLTNPTFCVNMLTQNASAGKAIIYKAQALSPTPSPSLSIFIYVSVSSGAARKEFPGPTVRLHRFMAVRGRRPARRTRNQLKN